MKYKKLNGGIKMENQKCQFCGNNCYNTCFETETFIQELNCREIK